MQQYPHGRLVNLDVMTYAGSLDNVKGVAHLLRCTFVQTSPLAIRDTPGEASRQLTGCRGALSSRRYQGVGMLCVYCTEGT
jgi:hypothetical protein